MPWLRTYSDYIVHKLQFDSTISYNALASLLETQLAAMQTRLPVYYISFQVAVDQNILALLTAGIGLTEEGRAELSRRDPRWLSRHRLRSIALLACICTIAPIVLSAVIGERRYRSRRSYSSPHLGGWFVLCIVAVGLTTVWASYLSIFMVKRRRTPQRLVQFAGDGVLAVLLMVGGIGLLSEMNSRNFSRVYDPLTAKIASPFVLTAAVMQMCLLIRWCVEVAERKHRELIREALKEAQEEQKLTSSEMSVDDAV